MIKTDPKSYTLAMKIIHLEDALKMANKLLNANGKLGVLPDHSVSFREGRKFHRRVREVLKNV